jgi:threonine dehydratase
VPRTIADALTVDQPGALTFPLLQAHGAQAVTVSDAELVGAMRVAVEALHLVLEPGGAAALAVALRGDFAGARVGVVASGGNIGADRFAELLRG